MNITVLGSRGFLSKELNSKIYSYSLENDKKFIDKYNFLIATFSSTLREDNSVEMKNEIKYYEKLIVNLKSNDFLIYISSQTLELTNFTFYSKAKSKIEELIKSRVKNYVIVRPGMIFDENKSRFTLDSMHKSSSSKFTFLNDYPKTTACTINDIFELILCIKKNPNSFSKQIINIGIKRFKFSELQNIENKKKYRFKLISFRLIKLLSFFNKRLQAYSNGKAFKPSPSLGWLSTFDKI